MFVRINSTPNSPRKSIQIVESVRNGDKVRQKIIRYVGIAMNDYEQERLVAFANDIILEMEKKLAQPELFDDIAPQTKPGRKKKKLLSDILPLDKVAITDIRESARIIDGVDEIAGSAYDELGFNKLLRGSNQLLKDIILARLVHPYSKHKLCKVLAEQFNKEYSLMRILINSATHYH